MIGAYNPTTGAFQGFLQDWTGNPIVIPGFWGISFGNGSKKGGPPNVLYFAIGGEDELIGVFGQITANQHRAFALLARAKFASPRWRAPRRRC